MKVEEELCEGYFLQDAEGKRVVWEDWCDETEQIDDAEVIELEFQKEDCTSDDWCELPLDGAEHDELAAPAWRDGNSFQKCGVGERRFSDLGKQREVAGYEDEITNERTEGNANEMAKMAQRCSREESLFSVEVRKSVDRQPVKVEYDFIRSSVAIPTSSTVAEIDEQPNTCIGPEQHGATVKRMVQGTLSSFLGLKRKPDELNAGSESRKIQKQIDSYFLTQISAESRRRMGATKSSEVVNSMSNENRTTWRPSGEGTIVQGSVSEAMELKQTSQKANNFASTGLSGKQAKRALSCPFYKKIPETSFAVDAFMFGAIPGISAYFLTHFHSDHYGGLSKAWTHGPIYCTSVTATLARMCLGVDTRWLCPLPIGGSRMVGCAEVTFLPANHCPGAALILFRLPSGTAILHTGDFRGSQAMQSYPHLRSVRIDALFLDTTYCHPRYCFPLQEDVIRFVVETTLQRVQRSSKTLVVVGSYSIGKERLFLAVSQALKVNICVDSRRKRVLQALEWPELSDRLTTDGTTTPLHVLPLGHLNPLRLREHLKRFEPFFSSVLAFRPTGWTYNERLGAKLELVKPRTSGVVSVYGVPYSEHSSFNELREFVQFLRPGRIVPTVNVGKAEDRRRMQTYFQQWMKSP